MSAIIENGVLVRYQSEPDEPVYVIPDTVTEIGPYAFQGEFGKPCYLKQIIIPSTVKKIGDFGLSGLRSVDTELIVPDSVTELGRGCFNASGFTRIVIGRGVKVLPSFCCDGNMTLKEIVLPDTLEELCTSSLGAVRAMRTLRIPDSVRIFRRRALTGSDLFLDGGVNFPKNVELVEDLAFDGASGIAEVELADGVTKVWDGSFSGALSLRKVTLPDSVTEIGYKAFAYCKKLAEVQFSRNLKVIGERAFSGDSSLVEVVLPEGVEEIAPKAFYACVNLKKLVIPASVKKLGKDAFYHCPALQDVELPEHLACMREDAFTQYAGAVGAWRYE